MGDFKLKGKEKVIELFSIDAQSDAT